MAKESLSLGENRSGVKTPALFLVQRPTERYNLSTVRVSFPLASSRSRSFIDAGVRDYPDVDLDQGQNWPVLVGSTAICWPLFTVKHGSRFAVSSPGINRVLSPLSLSFPFISSFSSLRPINLVWSILNFHFVLQIIDSNFQKKKQFKIRSWNESFIRIIFHLMEGNFYCDSS